MKKLVGLLLICVMLLGMSSVAFGLEDVLKVSKEIAINYTNGDLVKVKLVDSPKTKEVEISQEAMEYMAQNNKQLCINMDYVELTIDPKEVVNHSAWKAGLKKLEPLQLNLTVEVKDLANSVKYFSDGTYTGNLLPPLLWKLTCW